MEISTNNRNDIELFYSSIEEADANFLKAKEYEIIKIGNSYLTDLGKVFKEAQERLSNSKDGVFVEWIKHLEISHQTVYNLINRYDFVFKNFENHNLIENLPKTLSYEIAKPSAPQELVQKVIDGDIKTHKAYKELEAKLKLKEDTEKLQTQRINSLFQEKQSLAVQVEELKNKPKEKEYIEVESPELQKALFDKEQELGRIKLRTNEMNQEIQALKSKLNEVKLTIEEKAKLEQEIEKLNRYKHELKQQAEKNNILLNAVGTLKTLTDKLDKFLSNDAMPITLHNLENNEYISNSKVEFERRIKLLYNWILTVSQRIGVNYE